MSKAIDGKLFSGVSVLLAVVEAGTLARAAEALGLSPSGVSRALSRLEQRVGARLLARTTRWGSFLDGIDAFDEAVELRGLGLSFGMDRESEGNDTGAKDKIDFHWISL